MILGGASAGQQRPFIRPFRAISNTLGNGSPYLMTLRTIIGYTLMRRE